MADNATKLDIAPLTLIVSDALDPRVRRKLEAEQQADVKTYEEMTRTMQMQEDLTKIKQEVEENGEENDPFEQPEAVEDTAQQQQPEEQPADANQPQQAEQQPAPEQQQQQPEQQQQPAPDANAQQPAQSAEQPQQTNEDAGGDDEDLSSAFESYGAGLPKNLIHRVLKDYIKMESSDVESTGELEHIKNFVYINLGDNEVGGDTLESVQTLRDPENTIVVINEDSSPSADVTLRARQVAEQLSNRGVKVFYDADEAVNYLNELYDVVSGRKKEQ